MTKSSSKSKFVPYDGFVQIQPINRDSVLGVGSTVGIGKVISLGKGCKFCKVGMKVRYSSWAQDTIDEDTQGNIVLKEADYILGKWIN